MQQNPGVGKVGIGVEILNSNGAPMNPATGFALPAYDYIGANYAGATADVYTYKTGGSGGSTVATITINYTSSTKAVIASVVQT